MMIMVWAVEISVTILVVILSMSMGHNVSGQDHPHSRREKKNTNPKFCFHLSFPYSLFSVFLIGSALMAIRTLLLLIALFTDLASPSTSLLYHHRSGDWCSLEPFYHSHLSLLLIAQMTWHHLPHLCRNIAVLQVEAFNTHGITTSSKSPYREGSIAALSSLLHFWVSLKISSIHYCLKTQYFLSFKLLKAKKSSF